MERLSTWYPSVENLLSCQIFSNLLICVAEVRTPPKWVPAQAGDICRYILILIFFLNRTRLTLARAIHLDWKKFGLLIGLGLKTEIVTDITKKTDFKTEPKTYKTEKYSVCRSRSQYWVRDIEPIYFPIPGPNTGTEIDRSWTRDFLDNNSIGNIEDQTSFN